MNETKKKLENKMEWNKEAKKLKMSFYIIMKTSLVFLFVKVYFFFLLLKKVDFMKTDGKVIKKKRTIFWKLNKIISVFFLIVLIVVAEFFLDLPNKKTASTITVIEKMSAFLAFKVEWTPREEAGGGRRQGWKVENEKMKSFFGLLVQHFIWIS